MTAHISRGKKRGGNLSGVFAMMLPSNWGSGCQVLRTPNFFSVKWTGKVKAPVTRSYIFTVVGDDGIRLFLNGAKVVDGLERPRGGDVFI